MPKVLTAEETKAIQEREIRVACPRCEADISEHCTFSEIQVPMGRNAAGQVVMISETSVARPLICPYCKLSLLDKPSPIAVPGH